MSKLWNKNRPTEADVQAAQQAATLDRIRKGLLPGTWLQLSASPAPARPSQEEKWLSLSPMNNALSSPAMAAEGPGPIAEELALDGDRYLSNNASTSRSSSVSSTKPSGTKMTAMAAATFTPVPSICEREVIGLARFRAE